jgi:hypothetical protein
MILFLGYIYYFFQIYISNLNLFYKEYLEYVEKLIR